MFEASAVGFVPLVPAGCGFCGLRAGHLHCRESLPTIELTQNTFSSAASMHFCILRPAANKILIGVLFASIDSLLYLRGCEGPCKHCLGILMWRLFRKKIVNFPFSPTRGQHIPTSIQVSEKVYLANISSAKHCWIMLEMMMMEVIMVMMTMMEVIMVMITVLVTLIPCFAALLPSTGST